MGGAGASRLTRWWREGEREDAERRSGGNGWLTAAKSGATVADVVAVAVTDSEAQIEYVSQPTKNQEMGQRDEVTEAQNRSQEQSFEKEANSVRKEGQVASKPENVELRRSNRMRVSNTRLGDYVRQE